MSRVALRTARFAVAALFLVCVLTQVLLPTLSRDIGAIYDETRPFVVTYAVAGILALFFFEIGLIIMWRLLGRVLTGALFTPSTYTAMNALIALFGLAAAIPALTMLHLLVIVGVGGPGIILMLVICIILGITSIAIIASVKQLLTVAGAEHAELEEVI